MAALLHYMIAMSVMIGVIVMTAGPVLGLVLLQERDERKAS